MVTSSSDSNASDDLRSHVINSLPGENSTGVALGTTISVVFDRDVKTMSISKLFEVCLSILYPM